MESLTPAQQVIKIVNEELVKLMGGEAEKLTISPKPPHYNNDGRPPGRR